MHITPVHVSDREASRVDADERSDGAERTHSESVTYCLQGCDRHRVIRRIDTCDPAIRECPLTEPGRDPGVLRWVGPAEGPVRLDGAVVVDDSCEDEREEEGAASATGAISRSDGRFPPHGRSRTTPHDELYRHPDGPGRMLRDTRSGHEPRRYPAPIRQPDRRRSSARRLCGGLRTPR